MCAICTEPYTCPKVLPCHHSFCQACIHPMVHNGILECPICRDICTLLENKGVEALPNDFRISQVKDVFQSLQKQEKENLESSKCDICKYDEKCVQSAKYCISCSKNMCLACAEEHSAADYFSNHAMISTSGVPKIRCAIHKGEHLNLYCMVCQKLVCIVCAMKQCKKHRTTDFSTAAKELQVPMQEVAETLGILTKSPLLIRLPSQLQKRCTEKKESLRKIQDDILKAACIAKQKIAMNEQRLLDQLKVNIAMHIEVIDKDIDRRTMQIGTLSSLQDYVSDVSQPGNELKFITTFISVIDRIETELKTATSITCDLPDLQVTFTESDDIELGQLTFTNVTVPIETLIEKPTLSAVGDIIPVTHITGDEWDSSSDSEEFKDAEDDMGYKDNTGVIHRRLGMPWSGDVWDGAFTPDNHLAITSGFGGMGDRMCSGHLILLDTSGKEVDSLFGKQTSITPRCLAYHPGIDALLVTDRKKPMLTMVRAYSGNLEIVRDVTLVGAKEPSGIAVLRSGKIVVTETGCGNKHGFRIHDVEGNLISAIYSHKSNKSKNPGTFINPNYVAVDPFDRIIISDQGNQCIKLFDQNGKFIRQIYPSCEFTSMRIDDGITDLVTNHNKAACRVPYGVSTDIDGNIWLAHNLTGMSLFQEGDGRIINEIGSYNVNIPVVCSPRKMVYNDFYDRYAVIYKEDVFIGRQRNY